MAQRSRKRGHRAKPRSQSTKTSQKASTSPSTSTSQKESPSQKASPSQKTSASPKTSPSQTASASQTTTAKATAEQTEPQMVGGWRVEPQVSKSERRNAEIRAGLTPIAPGEHPGAIVVAAVITGVVGLGQLIAFLAGLKFHGKTPAAGETIAFCLVMIACAAGLWRLWYGAVLGFMVLLAVVIVGFSLGLIEASNLLGVIVSLVVVLGGGYLFFKLVRVLSRIQMPKYPGAPTR